MLPKTGVMTILIGGKIMKKSDALQIIANKIAGCTKCAELTTYRVENGNLTCPGNGNFDAEILILGEGPGKEESESGNCFVGRAGKLLDNIIKACGWNRDELFICNIVKCRCPGNRDPLPDEAANCRKYLDLQIQCVDPKYIICLGRIASIHLLGKSLDRTMGSLRGVHEYKNRIVVCTYHPSYALRNPSAKQEIWNDLALIREKTHTSGGTIATRKNKGDIE
jgi:uracil-DNA glycosylase